MRRHSVCMRLRFGIGSTLLNVMAVRIHVYVMRMVGSGIGGYIVGVAYTVIAYLAHKVTNGVVAVPGRATLGGCAADTT